MIGMIQIALHIPLLAVQVSSNALSFFSTLFPIINYDLLAQVKIYNNFLKYVSRLTNSKEKSAEDSNSGIGE